MQKRHCGPHGGFHPPRRIDAPPKVAVTSELVCGVLCQVWGHKNISTARKVFILVPGSEFDFCTFLFGVSGVGFKFVVVTDVQRLLALLVGLGNPNVCVLAAGEACVAAAVAVNHCLVRKTRPLLAAGFFHPVMTSSITGPLCVDLVVVLENSFAEFDKLFTKSKVSRNYHSLFASSSPSFSSGKAAPLTQYSPPSPAVPLTPVAENANPNSMLLALVCEVCNVHFRKPSLRLYRADLQQFFTIDFPPGAVVKEGDVVQVSGNELVGVVGKDDAVGVDFLHLVTRQAPQLPKLLNAAQQQARKQSYPLDVLVSHHYSKEERGLFQEGRADFEHVMVIGVQHLKVLMTDSSLPEGLFAVLHLTSSGLHKPTDFYSGQHLRLLQVRIEWKQDEFRAVLDNQSGVQSIANVNAPTSKLKLHFVSLQDLAEGKLLSTATDGGEYRTRAQVRDVFLCGLSWTNELCRMGNVFAWMPHLQAVFANSANLQVLLAGADGCHVLMVGCDCVHELLPFVRLHHPPKATADVEELFAQLVLAKQVLNALVFEHNTEFDVALRIQDSNFKLKRLEV
ncbi:hypothetical protein BASA81_002783 [Batrachochytrium salamandrivorans]|nr:hypothetical protein BASA81_002783 [Batrachochytrium salamandrivorans]